MAKMKSFKPYNKFGEEPNEFISSFWYFDDKRKGFNEEPFLLGMSELLTDLVAYYIKEEVENFHLLISEEDFPGSQGKLNYIQEYGSYNFYGWNCEGCDSTLEPKTVSLENFIEKYFSGRPETLYLRVERTVKW